MYYHVFILVLHSCWEIRGEASVDLKTRTLQTSFSSAEIIPTTTVEYTSDGTTNISLTTSQNSEEQTESSLYTCDKNICGIIVRKCGTKFIDKVMNSEEEDHDDSILASDDSCKCAFECFQTKLRRMWLNGRMRGGWRHHADGDEHSVLNHLGELIGTFGTGIVLGVFMALLIVNQMKRCGHQRPKSSTREERSDSKAGLPAVFRDPMPPPALTSDGIYTAGPIVVSHMKYDRVSSKGLYEELDGNETGSPRRDHRPSSKESGQSAHNVYFVLEDETLKGEEESEKEEDEKEEDADNMPSEVMNYNTESSVNRQSPQPTARKPRKPPRRQKSDTEESRL